MKSNCLLKILVTFLMFALLLSIPLTCAVSEFDVTSTNLKVYRDGVVQVSHTLIVNDTLPAVSIPLLGSSSDNFIILDANQTLLDYQIDSNSIKILTLGTTFASVQYDTSSLTSKDAEVWTFFVDTPYNLTVVLPEEATVLSLSDTPVSIDVDDKSIVFSLFPEQWEISYVFPISPPADFQVTDLKITPTEVTAGEEVSISLKVTNIGGQTGVFTLPLVVNQTIEDSKTVNLDGGESIIIAFLLTKQTAGSYTVKADEVVGQFVVNENYQNGTYSTIVSIEFLFLIVAIGIVIFAVMFFIFRKKTNIEKIFKIHPQLNEEEKAVIRFLAENDRKAFESQIREKFVDIPRTSLWRLVRRLEKLDIITLKKIGLENQVELKK